MMIEPPIDKLIKKAECRYALTCAVSRRARELMSKDTNDELSGAGEKAISKACNEIYNEEILITRE